MPVAMRRPSLPLDPAEVVPCQRECAEIGRFGGSRRVIGLGTLGRQFDPEFGFTCYVALVGHHLDGLSLSLKR
jgi:hypothetical protein